jgi:SHS2 domain-containing protein
MFKVISHTADVGLQLKAPTLEKLFEDAALGLKYCLVENGDVESKESKDIVLTYHSPEELMVQWLNELNYLATVHSWILNEVKNIKIVSKNSGWSITSTILGENLDFDRHEIAIDIKAVTYHQLKIEQVEGMFTTRLFFDI